MIGCNVGQLQSREPLELLAIKPRKHSTTVTHHCLVERQLKGALAIIHLSAYFTLDNK
jgi:hypothetical protein